MTLNGLQQRMIDLLNWLENQKNLPTLAALSYTLNAGRQHFSKRCCMMVKTIAELKKQLRSILSSKDIQAQLLDYKLPNTNHHPADLTQLCHDYLKGKSIDWRTLYGEYQEKISLPSYPFAKESHWVYIKKNVHHPHTLIDENISTFSSSAFSKRFTGNEFYLRDHLINNEPVLPGAVCLEMVRIAANMAAKNQQVTTLSQIIWERPIKNPDLATPLHVVLFPETDSASFSITDQDEAVSYVRGMIHYTDNSSDAPPYVLKLNDLKSTLPNTQDPKAIYSYFNHAGITYGPSFQVIQSIHFDEHHLVAEIALPANLATQHHELVLHPCLLDGILQTTQVLLKNREVLYLPFSIEQLDIYKPLPNLCYVHASLISTADSQHMPTLNIQVSDAEGALLLVINGFSLYPVHEPAATVAYYSHQWIPQAAQAATQKHPDSILILGDNEQSVLALSAQFPDRTVSYQLLKEPSHLNINIDKLSECIILALEEFHTDSLSITEIQQKMEQTYYLVHAVVNQISKLKPKQPIQLVGIVKNASIYSRALDGFAKCLHQEQSNISCRFIELHDLSLLTNELTQNEIYVRYDQRNQRYIRDYFPLPLLKETPPPLKKSGVYLITGGMGGLGYLFATYLAKHYQAKMVLTGRSPLSERHQKRIAELEQHGASVAYVSTDVSSYEEVHALIQIIKERFGALNGIIHAAGLTQDGLIVNKTLPEIEKVVAPKIFGACNLHTATRQEPLDFFALFSSAAAVFGNLGQSDYAYANCFLDEFAYTREQQRAQGHCNGHTLSINWPLWEEGVYRLLPNTNRSLSTL